MFTINTELIHRFFHLNVNISQTSIQEKNRLFKKYLNFKSSYSRSIYTLYQNKVNKVLIASKRSNYNIYFINNSLNINTWKGIRGLIAHESIIQSTPTKLISDNNNELKDGRELANDFNKYFCKMLTQTG